MADVLGLGNTNTETPAAGAVGEQKAEPGGGLYPVDVALRPAFEQRRDDLAVGLGLDTTKIAAREADFTDVMRQTGLDPHVVGTPLYDLLTSAELAEQRGAEAVDVQPLNEESRRLLRETYGAKDAEDLLARAQSFVASQPKLAAMLRTRGIGSQPKVVAMLVEHVRVHDYRGPVATTLAGTTTDWDRERARQAAARGRKE